MPAHKTAPRLAALLLPSIACPKSRNSQVANFIMHRYIAYGLKIAAELPLPELVPAPQSFEAEAADVVIRLGGVDLAFLQDDASNTYRFRVTPDDAVFYWETLGAMRVHSGREIVVEPEAGVEERLLRLPILGSVFSVLLQQRGFLVLHASTVAIEGKAVAFLGWKGRGKSTMAATLHARGHRLLSDDIVATRLDNPTRPLVYPGFPQFKLWPDAVEALGEKPENLPQLYSEIEKRARSGSEGFSLEPVPLSRVYVLEMREDDADAIEIAPLPAPEAIAHLIAHTYSARFGNDLLRGPSGSQHFQNCALVAKAVGCRFLRRPSSLHLLPEIARRVEADVDGA